jgi:hypothetical protein
MFAGTMNAGLCAMVNCACSRLTCGVKCTVRRENVPSVAVILSNSRCELICKSFSAAAFMNGISMIWSEIESE